MEQWMNDYASWVLASSGVAAIYFIGRKQIWAWLWATLNEAMWIYYAIVTKQYGFIFAAIAYTIVYMKSYFYWKQLHKTDTLGERT
jgi:nicotinamide riboside transporter PnuC